MSPLQASGIVRHSSISGMKLQKFREWLLLNDTDQEIVNMLFSQNIVKEIIFSIKKANPSLWSLTLKLDCTKTGSISYIQHILCSTHFTSPLEDRGRGQGLLCYSTEVWFKYWFTHGYSMLLPVPARGSVQTPTCRPGFQKLMLWSAQLWHLDPALEVSSSLPQKKLGMLGSGDTVTPLSCFDWDCCWIKFRKI